MSKAARRSVAVRVVFGGERAETGRLGSTGTPDQRWVL
jgi:hypothetical protein